jgi:hypothetical protein
MRIVKLLLYNWYLLFKITYANIVSQVVLIDATLVTTRSLHRLIIDVSDYLVFCIETKQRLYRAVTEHFLENNRLMDRVSFLSCKLEVNAV